MDTRDIVVKTENCDSDEELLAEIRKELEKTRNVLEPDQEIVDLPFCIGTEEDNSNHLSPKVGSIESNNVSTLIAPDSKASDSFIIYEINEMSPKENEGHESGNPTNIETMTKFSKDELNQITVAHWPFRYPQPPIVQRRRFHKMEEEPPSSLLITSPLLKLLTMETNNEKLNSSGKSRQKHRKQRDSAVQKAMVGKSQESRKIAYTSTSPTASKSKNVRNVILRERYVVAPPYKINSITNRNSLLESRISFDKVCNCHLNTIKGSNVLKNLELKDFFERMFEETRKLSLERRQMVKMQLLKAVCRAEEDVEAGRFCQECYTV